MCRGGSGSGLRVQRACWNVATHCQKHGMPACMRGYQVAGQQAPGACLQFSIRVPSMAPLLVQYGVTTKPSGCGNGDAPCGAHPPSRSTRGGRAAATRESHARSAEDHRIGWDRK